jgi:hypothetical protein
MRKGAGFTEESDEEKGVENMAPDTTPAAFGALGSRLNAPPPAAPPPAIVGAASPRKLNASGIRPSASASANAAAAQPLEAVPRPQGLIGVPPDQVKELPSERFRALLEATPWGALSIEQLEVIDDDERLSFIANEVLITMAGALPDDGEDDGL